MKAFENSVVGSWLNIYRNNPFLKRLTSVLGIDILVKASVFILLPLYLRLMNQEEYGLYNYLLSIIQTFSIVLNLGFYVAQSKMYHEFESGKQKGAAVFTINISLLVFLCLLVAVIWILKLDYTLIQLFFKRPFPYSEYRMIIIPSLLVSIFSFMLTNFLYTSEKIAQVKRYNLSRIIIVNLACLASLYFIPANAVKLRFTVVNITELFIFLVFLRSLVREFTLLFNRAILIKSLKIGLPITLSSIFSFFITFSDKFFLEKYGSLRDLSNYYLAFTFAGILPTIFSSLQNIWLPIFLKEKDVRKNMEKTGKLISRISLIFLFISICIWILFAMLLYWHIIPSKYQQVIYILPLLLVSQIFSTISSLYGNYLLYFDKTHLASVAGFLAGIFTVGLCFLLIPKWGVYGSAITTLASSIFYLALYYWWIQGIKKRTLTMPLPAT